MTPESRWTGRLHDVWISSDHPIAGLVRSAADPKSDPAPDLAVRRTTEAPRAALAEPFYVSEDRPGGRPHAVVRRLTGNELLLETPDGEFVVGRRQIVYRREPGSAARSLAFRARLEGPALAIWLEEHRRALVLHGAAVVLGEGGAVAFLGGNGAGKSSLAGALLAVAPPAALRLVTDDLLAIDFSDGRPAALPGPPRLRLDRASRNRLTQALAAAGVVARRVAGEADEAGGEDERGKTELPLVPAAAALESVPLAAIYLLGRGPVERPRFEPVPTAARVLELLGRSYAPRLAEAAGWRERRLEQLARLVEAIPVARLVMPVGIAGLPAAARELLADLSA